METITVGMSDHYETSKPYSYGKIDGIQQAYEDSDTARKALEYRIEHMLEYEVGEYRNAKVNYGVYSAGTGGYWYAEIFIVRNDDDRGDDDD